MRIVASHQLDLAIEEVELRLDELQVLLPRLASRCSAIKPSTLAALLRDPGGALVPRLITLRQLLPGADIASLAAAEPELLLLREASDLRRGLERLQQLLGPAADVGAIVQREPRMLDEELVGCAAVLYGPGRLTLMCSLRCAHALRPCWHIALAPAQLLPCCSPLPRAAQGGAGGAAATYAVCRRCTNAAERPLLAAACGARHPAAGGASRVEQLRTVCAIAAPAICFVL